MKHPAGINEIEELLETCTKNGGDVERIQKLLNSFEFSQKTILITMGLVLHSASDSKSIENMLRCKHLLQHSLQHTGYHGA